MKATRNDEDELCKTLKWKNGVDALHMPQFSSGQQKYLLHPAENGKCKFIQNSSSFLLSEKRH